MGKNESVDKLMSPDSGPGFPTDQRLGYKVKVVSNSYRRAVDRSLASYDITASQSFILGWLSRHRDKSPSQHQIEQRFNIKHPTATGLLKRMSDKGLVEFHGDENDRRIKRVVITQAGVDIVESTGSQLDKVDDTLTSALTPDELETLNTLLDKLVERSLQLREELNNPSGKDQ